jgi:hypothetical protein
VLAIVEHHQQRARAGSCPHRPARSA